MRHWWTGSGLPGIACCVALACLSSIHPAAPVRASGIPVASAVGEQEVPAPAADPGTPASPQTEATQEPSAQEPSAQEPSSGSQASPSGSAAPEQKSPAGQDQEKTPAQPETKPEAENEKSAGEQAEGDKPDAEKAAGSDDDRKTEEVKAAVVVSELEKYARKMRNTRNLSRLSPSMIALVEPLIADIAPRTARIWSGNKQLAIGVVAAPEGMILTVASELKNPIECQLADGRRLPARVIGVHKASDLAMLKVDATDLQPVEFSTASSPDIGNWLVSVSPDNKPLGLGIVGVREREIGAAVAFIGILMEAVEKGVRVSSVTPDSPAAKAKLQEGDVISAIDHHPVTDNESVRELLQSEYQPGDTVELSVQRGEDSIKVALELGDREQFAAMPEQTNQQDRMGSSLSRRRSKFPLAIQHDSSLSASQMGSPILDLDGAVVGLNISRSGRVSTLALPSSIVVAAVAELATGNLAPAVVNRARIEEISDELFRLGQELSPLGDKLKESRAGFAGEEARTEELKRIRKDLDQRIADVESRSAELEKSYRELEKQFDDLSRRTRSLEEERRLLETGAR